MKTKKFTAEQVQGQLMIMATIQGWIYCSIKDFKLNRPEIAHQVYAYTKGWA